MHTSVINCRGIILKNDELDTYLSNRVRKWHYDTQGVKEFYTEISKITGFDTADVKKRLPRKNPPKTPWRIGESFAQCFLMDYWFAKIPYPPSRDLKNPNAILTGADIVGFYFNNDETTFLFGEVKTSQEDRHPLGVVTKQRGLLAQMKDLKCKNIQASTIIWLKHTITENDPCKQHLNDAIKSYLCWNAVRLVGILIRDTSPNKADLQYAFERLKSDTKTHLDMWALYLPIPISSLPEKIGVA